MAGVGVLKLLVAYDNATDLFRALLAASGYGADREELLTNLELEKLRLMTWAVATGLTSVDTDPAKAPATNENYGALDETLQLLHMRRMVEALLMGIALSVEDADALLKRHGLAIDSGCAADVATPSLIFSEFHDWYSGFQKALRELIQTPGMFEDRSVRVVDEIKIHGLVAELKAINDALEALIPSIASKARARLQEEIDKISRMEHLDRLLQYTEDVGGLVSRVRSLRLADLEEYPDGVPNKPSPDSPAVSCGHDDRGSLVVQIEMYKPNRFRCRAYLTSLSEAPELDEVQRAFHPAFEAQFLPGTVIGVADMFLETDVDADPKYAGWSPGTTSMTGFALEYCFWQTATDSIDNKRAFEHQWARLGQQPTLGLEFLCQRWDQISRDEGFGSDWTERTGHDQVRRLTGPSNFAWLDPSEGFKIRHQISDLAGAIVDTPIPSLQDTTIGHLAFNQNIDPLCGYNYTDFIGHLVKARELTLRIQRSQRAWHGGITIRIIYDMVMAELWRKHMVPKPGFWFGASEESRTTQIEGLMKFIAEMDWPYGADMQRVAREMLGPNRDQMQADIPVWNWLHGLVRPGGCFVRGLLKTLQSMSQRMFVGVKVGTIDHDKGSYGILYDDRSYWCYRSVLGKVLAVHKNIKCLGGWVGPCPMVMTTHLDMLPSSTFGLEMELDVLPPPLIPTSEAAQEHSSQNNKTPEDWIEVTPPPPSFETVSQPVINLSLIPRSTTEPDHVSRVPLCSASLHFTLAHGTHFPEVPLRYNSIFVSAPPCRGTHRVDPRLAAKYTFRTLRVLELALAELEGGGNMALTVINATASGEAHALARAWCCWKGTNAVVWEIDSTRTCFKCALTVASTEGLSTGVLIMC